MRLPTVLDLTRTFVAQALRPGDVAVDATVGNGHDTVFLAEHVGASGYVYGFDVQAEALQATRQRLSGQGLDGRVRLYLCGHERMQEELPLEVRGRIRAVMFNLGYLPGAPGKDVITQPSTTLAALEAALDLLDSSGVITAVVYPAHAGGREEADAAVQWAAALPRDTCSVYTYAPLNTRRPAPRLLAIEKAAGRTGAAIS